jgi:hypothetical protein
MIRRLAELLHHFTHEIDTNMTEYMKSGKSIDPPDPWGESPFEQLDNLRGVPSEKLQETIRTNAGKIRSKTLRTGEIRTDEAVEPAMSQHATDQVPELIYYRRAGPIADSAEDIRWNTTYRLAPDAPTFKSEAWKEAAAALDIPDSNRTELVPELVTVWYSALDTRRQIHDRIEAIHPEELKRIDPCVSGGGYRRAFEYLEALPGVEAPDKDAPAWENVDTKTSASGTAAKSHGD